MDNAAWDWVQGTLETWRDEAERRRAMHYRLAGLFEKWHLLLGIPVVILTALIGTSAFASLQQGPVPAVQVATGVIGVVAAILSALQTFLRYGEWQEKHRTAAHRYGSLKREIMQVLALPPALRKEPIEVLDHMASYMGNIEADAPLVPSELKRTRHSRTLE